MKIKNLNDARTTISQWIVVALAAALIVGNGCSTGTPPPAQLPPLSTVSDSPRLSGKFVWADLVTDDVPAARKFYSQLFGWTFRKVGDYVIACNDDRPLGGMFQRPRPKDQSAAPRWFAYISVSNVERATQAVTRSGGKVLMEPQTFPKRGKQAVFTDVEGAVFGVMKSSSGDPQDFLADPGDWIWIQLLSHDGRKAAEFYRIVGGYEIVENNNTNRLSDYVLTSEGYARATVRTIPGAKQKEVKPAWLPFVRVKSVAVSAALAKQSGGKVLLEPRPELLDGKVAVIADPTGAAIGIMEWPEGFLKGGN
jgi:hypothetical protein